MLLFLGWLGDGLQLVDYNLYLVHFFNSVLPDVLPWL